MENTSYPKWAVIGDVGTDKERIIDRFHEYAEALKCAAFYCSVECDTDIMKIEQDGNLTTEF